MLLANMVAEIWKVSTSAARQLISDGAVKINDKLVTLNPKAEIFWDAEMRKWFVTEFGNPVWVED